MPRIPDELIERLKAEVPIRLLVERSGVELKTYGENLSGLCLWHDEKTPSLIVTPSKGLWHCMGACQEGGSVIDWVMKTEGVSFRAAVEILLLEFFPMEARALHIGSPPKRSTVPKLPSPFDAEASEEEIARGVVSYYHEKLKETPDALSFLSRRGIDTAEVIEHFQLGFSDRTLGLRLPLANRKPGLAIRTTLEKIGIYRPTKREHFVGCLTIPFFDQAGRVVGMYGRRIEQNLPANMRHLYSAGPHRGVLNRQAFEPPSKEIILCEAPIDAVTFFRWGLRNVTTSYGAEGFTDELLLAFVSHGIERCFIAYDRDEAGDKGARKAAEKLMAAGIECYRVQFPKGMDANEVALKMTPADKTLGHFVRTAEWMGSGARPGASHALRASDAHAPAPPTATRAAKDDASKAPPLVAAEVAAEDENDGAAKKEKLSKPVPEAGPEALDPSPTFRFAQAETHSDATARATQVLERAPEASAHAAALAPAVDVEMNGDDEALFRFEDRSYNVQGLKKALRSGSLQVRVHAQRDGDFFAPPSPIQGWFLDRFDFVSSLARSRFEKQAAQEMGVKVETVKWDLGRVLRRLEELQRQAIAEAVKPKVTTPAMTDEDRANGLDYGSAENLVERILADMDRSGVVGEKTNKLVGYLGGVSRLSDRPLAIIIRSSSAAGKTALMDAILRFLPPESREKYSALSGHALFYFEGKDFKHKVLAIVEEEGAQKASYALKLLQSEGEITIASTGKDPGTGRLVTKEYLVEGPVMIFLVSTSAEIDDELLNRAIVLTVDEGREQTRAIHEIQRFSQTLEGLWAKDDREKVYKKHHNFQRLLRPLAVVNPYVRELTFLDDRTRTRRDHTKYLGIIEAIALLHQYQRPLKTDTRGDRTKEYIEATLDDVALANRIAAEVLGRTLDELGPQTRRFLLLLDEMVKETCECYGVSRSDFRFSRRDVRLFTGWCDSQVRIHLARLLELEYAVTHRGGRGQTFVYELLYDGKGKDGTPFLIGLADVEALAKTHGLPVPREVLEPLERREGAPEGEPTMPTSPNFSTTSRGHCPTIAPPLPKGRGAEEPAPHTAPSPISAELPENSHLEAAPKSYAQGGRSDGSRNVPRLRVNLLRFPPGEPAAQTPEDAKRRASHRVLMMRRVTRGF